MARTDWVLAGLTLPLICVTLWGASEGSVLAQAVVIGIVLAAIVGTIGWWGGRLWYLMRGRR